jgi:hypothetical protein
MVKTGITEQMGLVRGLRSGRALVALYCFERFDDAGAKHLLPLRTVACSHSTGNQIAETLFSKSDVVRSRCRTDVHKLTVWTKRT